MDEQVLDLVVPPGAQVAGRNLHRCLRAAEDHGAAIADLRGASWFDPAGLVGVATYVDSQLSIGRSVYVFGPADRGVASYASRMRLGRVLADLGAEHDLENVNEHDTGIALLELTRFTGETGADQLAEHLFNNLEHRDRRLADALYESVCEIGSNVPQHSGREHGFVAAQSTWHGREVRFAVGDSGVGIGATLAPFGIESDGEAVQAVLEEGFSSTGEPGRGRGIPRTRELVTGAGGSLFLTTGNAQRTAYSLASTGAPNSLPVPGTLLQGLITRTSP